LEAIIDAKNPQKLVVQAVSYKPFISLFNMTGAAQMNESLAGIGRQIRGLVLKETAIIT